MATAVYTYIYFLWWLLCAAETCSCYCICVSTVWQLTSVCFRSNRGMSYVKTKSTPNVRHLQCPIYNAAQSNPLFRTGAFSRYLWRMSRNSWRNFLSIYMPSHTISTTGLTECKIDQFLEFVLFQSAAFIFIYRQWNYLQTATTKHSLQRSKSVWEQSCCLQITYWNKINLQV